LPGAAAASAAIDLPLDGNRFGLGGVRVPGVELPHGREQLTAAGLGTGVVEEHE
jgi:hypothetical protein